MAKIYDDMYPLGDRLPDPARNAAPRTAVFSSNRIKAIGLAAALALPAVGCSASGAEQDTKEPIDRLKEEFMGTGHVWSNYNRSDCLDQTPWDIVMDDNGDTDELFPASLKEIGEGTEKVIAITPNQMQYPGVGTIYLTGFGGMSNEHGYFTSLQANDEVSRSLVQTYCDQIQ